MGLCVPSLALPRPVPLIGMSSQTPLYITDISSCSYLGYITYEQCAYAATIEPMIRTQRVR